MAAKELAFNTEARAALKRGVDQLAEAVRVTLGPRGRNVVLDRKFGSPTVTKDGVTVAKEVELEDPVENMGAQMVKEVATKTSDLAGDGTESLGLVDLSKYGVKQVGQLDPNGTAYTITSPEVQIKQIFIYNSVGATLYGWGQNVGGSGFETAGLVALMTENPGPLYVVLVDHGGDGVFFLDDFNQTVVPEELDSWLSELEAGLAGTEAEAEPRVLIVGA